LDRVSDGKAAQGRRTPKRFAPQGSGAAAIPQTRHRTLAGRVALGLKVAALLFLTAAHLAAQTPEIDRASQLELQGRFREASQVLSNALASTTLSGNLRKQHEFELDRLGRIRQDFPLTQESLFEALNRAVKGLTRREYERWIREGRFDSREIDGRRYFMVSSVSNLFFRYPELNARRLPPRDTAALEKQHWRTCQEIQEAVKAQKRPYVLPKRFEATMTVTVKSNAVPAGETVRAWLPIPRSYPFQTDFELLSTSSRVVHLDDPESPIRSVALEQAAGTKEPVRFAVQYAYTMHAVRFEIEPDAVTAADTNTPALAPFVREAPHVQFTPEMCALSRQIAGSETNPYRKAKKFYDWIAERIQYSYAIEYSTIRNIGEYCRARGYGDCGQEALLFITLCRLNGIPARWQSGWSTFPGAKTIHDWAEIYLPPHGWIPVDPYMGIYAMRYATSLKPSQKRALRDFYFGGLDSYRMIANSDHSQEFSFPKQSLRSDTVDFQRGELECGPRNLYFDQFSYDLSVRELAPP
jgi:transglutaminase-like putative cysteine protease